MSLCNAAFSIEQASIREAAAVIQVSQPYLDFWSQLMPEQARKMVVIGNGTEPCPPVNRSMDREDGLFYVGYMGRCALQKSADMILEAVASDDWPSNCVLHWAGDDRGGEPALWQALVEMAKTYPGRLKLVGYLAGQEKWDFLAGVDAVLFPSRHEPFGIAGLEVMAAGTPLITSGMDGIATYANETNAIIVPPTVMGILAGISQAQGLLPHTRAAMITAGIAEAARHDWASIAKRVVDVYAYCRNIRSEFHVIHA